MPSDTGIRARRVATAVRARITELLAREVSDPLLTGLVVTDVELPSDLSIVWVKFRLLVGGDDPKRRSDAVRSLGRAGGHLRHGLGPSLRMKRVPEIRFVYDTGADASLRVQALLNEIEQEKNPK